MNKITEQKKFPTAENLKLILKTTNIGSYIKGNDFTDTMLKLDMELDKELSFEDIFKVEHEAENNTLIIETKEMPDINFRKVDFFLSVPKNASIETNSKNGGFKIADINGTIDAYTKNGSISLKRTESKNNCSTKNGKISIKESHCDAEIKTQNGGVKLDQVTGDISIDGKNGKIKCLKCKGSLNIKAVNGKIRILDSGLSSASVECSNGSIYYEFNQLEEGKFAFQNQNGKIHLIIPEDMPYSIKASNQLGKFYMGLPGDYEKEEKNNRHYLMMTQKSGKVKISAENKRGSIALLNKKNIEKGINFGGLGEEVSELMDKINSEEIRKKVHKNIEKAKVKLKKITIKNPENVQNIEKAAANLSEEIKEAISEEEFQKKGKELAAKIKKAAKNFVKDAKNFTEKEFKTGKRDKNEISQSRLKILQMLEDGKISTEEAEKLLKALEK